MPLPDPSTLRFPGAVDRSQSLSLVGVSLSVIKELALIHVPKPWMVPGKATCNMAAFSVVLSPQSFPTLSPLPFSSSSPSSARLGNRIIYIPVVKTSGLINKCLSFSWGVRPLLPPVLKIPSFFGSP